VLCSIGFNIKIYILFIEDTVYPVDLKPCKVCELPVEIPFPSLLLGRPSILLLAEDVGGIKTLLCLIKLSKLNIYWQLRTNVGITRGGMLILMSCFFLYRKEIESGKFIHETKMLSVSEAASDI